jgi:hypothetical protein
MFSKKLITAVLAGAALCAAGCSGSDVASQDPAGSSNSSLIAPCTTIPLVSGSFLGCSAFGATAALGAANTAAITASTAATTAAATTAQATLATNMNAIFAGLTVVPDITAMTVTIGSTAGCFGTLFGAPIVLPITATTGVFTGAIPFTVDGLPPLMLNVWGTFPLVNGAFATMPMTALNFSVGVAGTAAATSATTLAATTAATSTAMLASTLPLGFTCNATIPLTCPALAPAGFVAPAAIAPIAPIAAGALTPIAPVAPVAPVVGAAAPIGVGAVAF